MRQYTLKFVLAMMATLPALAFAHPEHEHTNSFLSGFSHPLGGLDHLLAMVAVGIWAVSLGGRAVWTVPTAFVATMLIGGGLAVAGVQLPFIEQGILLSVVFMGIMLLASVRMSISSCAAIVAAFALFHGAAHGLEMPLNANGIQYAAGFAIATALLHATGVAFGAVVASIQAPIINRIAGSLIALAGAFLAFV
ncbi:HupE/UreJ family protein [Marinomonas sp. THO17]|uniref:HupE/UreJ family protein n=1 Tax=Marinomonas sp. THO17 TaxID=3149048 RepID=UPI00336BFF78